MDARFLKKILVLLGILFFSLPIMIQPTMAQEIPAGLIVMWSGSVNDIPSGWTLCDGSNNTPDLRGRFILGAWGNPGTRGGSSYHNHQLSPIAINTNGAGSHLHEMGYPDNAANVQDYSTRKDVVADEFHKHVIYSAGLHGHSANIPLQNTNNSTHYPPYYQLAFIMKLPATHVCSNLTVVASYPAPGGGTPTGLAYYKNLYVADWEAGTVIKVKVSSDSLKVLDTIDLPGDCPQALEGLTHDGKNLWYTNGNAGMSCTPTILEFTELGEVLSSFVAPGEHSSGLTFDGEFLWNSQERGDDIGRIYKVSTSGVQEGEFESPGNGPRDLTFHKGYLWHIDYKTNNLYKLDSSANVLATCSLASEGIERPVGLTSDGTYLWVGEENTGMIHQLSISN